MELEKFDLHRLTILWQASNSNLELRKLIEAELKRRIVGNTNFSRECLFQICKMQNHAITISFIPTTDAYRNYGAHVTVDIILSDEEIEEMIQNYSAKPPINTSGQVKAKVLVTDSLTQEQIKGLETIGFHTREILETLHI